METIRRNNALIVVAKWVLTIFAMLFALTLLLWGVVIAFVATPEVVTPHVVNILQEHTRSKVSIKSVDLSLFDRFPNITLRIDSLRIAQTKDSIPDLISARQCRLAVDPFELIKNRHLAINNIAFHNADIYIYADSVNGPLKTFILPEESEKQVDTTAVVNLSDYTLSVKRLKIDSVNITIDDRRKEFYTRVTNYNANVSMNITSGRGNLDVVTGFSNLLVWRKGEIFVKKTSMELRSQMLYDRDSMTIDFKKAKLSINDIDLKVDGRLLRDTVAGGIQVDLRTSLNTPSLSEFLALIPTSVIDSKDKISTEGDVKFNMDIKGLYSDTSFPTIGATLKVNEAKAKYESRKLALERVDCDAYAFIDLNNPVESFTDIRSLHINTSDIIDLNVSGRVDNIIESPEVDLMVNSNFNFNRFTELFPLNEGITCSGTNVSRIKTQFKLDELKKDNYADIVIDGESILHNLDITIDPSKFSQDTTAMAYLHLAAEQGEILFGDNIRLESNSRTLRSMANFQDVSYKSKSGEYVSIKDVELTIGASFDRSTSKINGIGMRGIARNSNIGVDSLFNATMESSDITLIVKPKDETNPTIVSAMVNSQRIAANEPNYNSSIELSSVDAKMKLTRVYDNEDRRWDMEGNVSFVDYSMYSDILPIKIAIPESTVSMNNNTIFLNNAHLKVGESDIVATGNIKNLIRKLLIEPRTEVSGDLKVNAVTLDFGELLEASNNSILMNEEEVSPETSVTDDMSIVMGSSRSDDTATTPIVDSLGVEQEAAALFLVPRRVDFTFDLNIEKAIFWDTTINNLAGHATMNSGVLAVDKFSLDAIGAEAVGSLVYRNINRESANVAADIMLKRVDINRIGELIPSVGSMMPMLKSFEGIVDFELKALTNLDKYSMVDISTLYSSMRFKGDNLVLMDSETFADLSKTLMFKNKERNLIDSVEIFALVEESKVDVLPFLLSIDRYTAVIGGSQVIDPVTFNVNYNYQISILKSPLPFKAGVDVTGDLEDFKFKVTKAKLKKTDFDEQRQIYEEYSANIEASESELASDIEKHRNEMRAKRQAQRLAQERAEEEAANAEEEIVVETTAETEENI